MQASLLTTSSFVLILISTGICRSTVSGNEKEKGKDSLVKSSSSSETSTTPLQRLYSLSTTVPPDIDSSPEPEPILKEWGGNCTKKHWEKCSHLTQWGSKYLKDKKRPELGYEHHFTNCTIEPNLCLHNGWTVTRCQLMCMRCNREILSNYDKYVRKEGAC